MQVGDYAVPHPRIQRIGVQEHKNWSLGGAVKVVGQWCHASSMARTGRVFYSTGAALVLSSSGVGEFADVEESALSAQLRQCVAEQFFEALRGECPCAAAPRTGLDPELHRLGVLPEMLDPHLGRNYPFPQGRDRQQREKEFIAESEHFQRM